MTNQPEPENPIEPKAIAVRAFVPPSDSEPRKARSKRSSEERTSEWTLIFDTETTVDAEQNLRFGAFQLRRREALETEGLFYDPGILTEADQGLLRRFAKKRKLELLTKGEFIEKVFFQEAYECRASIVGFNLPFDISRLATSYGSARGKVMKGGFTFKLSPNRWWPNIQIKHISSRNALIQFAKPPIRLRNRRERKQGFEKRTRRGAFVDVKTIGAALLSESFSLERLSEFLEVPHRKKTTECHGERLTSKYVEYCLNDVQATWECFRVLTKKFDAYRLSSTRIGQILSEASLGKAYLREMGIKPFRQVQPDFPNELMGIISSTYYGGRSEVRLRRVRSQVLYCDFLSMYPTVCTLMGLWKFVIAKGITWKDSTAETQALVEEVSLGDLQSPDNWKRLRTIVKIKSDEDILSIRAKYCEEPGSNQSYTIGLNYLSSDAHLWYTLADVIASKLLTGKCPRIIQALAFDPLDEQSDLRAISIVGNKKYRIDPVQDDFFKRLIDLRAEIKEKMKGEAAPTYEVLKSEQKSVKLLANATSYGIFFEVNVSDLDRRIKKTCYGPGGSGFEIETDKIEEPGRYFHPLLATLITGGARLMLAISERLTLDAGLDWAFCDTDSMAIAKPAEMPEAEFYKAAQSICAWFEPLNPYEQKGSLFKVEDVNYQPSSNEKKSFEPLYAYCVSAKRYVLFNLDVNGKPLIRKASAHGLGHLLTPYLESEAPAFIPKPAIALTEIGVERWQYDLWYQILAAELEGHPDEVDLSYHAALELPAASRYGATTPRLLRWFKEHGKTRSYRDKVKPFNFLICFQSRFQVGFGISVEVAPIKKGPKPKPQLVKPIAAYDKNLSTASCKAFDRDTGKIVPQDGLKTYREALAQYHLSPELKFRNGDYLDRGRTERRHIHAVTIVHIGKETNKWEEQFFVGIDEKAPVEYGTRDSITSLDHGLYEICKRYGERGTARQLAISRSTIRKAQRNGCRSLSLSAQKTIKSRLLTFLSSFATTGTK